MTTNTAEFLAEQKRLAEAATPGPWAAWLDQDGQPHMNHMLMVGNAAAVIPEGDSWVEGVDVNPIAHTYTPEDRAFIAATRTSVPRMIAALEAVTELPTRLPYNDDPNAWSPDPLDGYTAEEAYARGVADAKDAIEAALNRSVG